ncbi:Multidrug efflux pump subunit AcrB [Desulfurella multipotens]|uniref:Multidrug efflux pump subunit AcrB n=1 Tax=Desulfurella multipotens TaxID=79269 RepID=A0A1G6NY12_9BACT|nr:efflux RND transporter permease subunit [Desulfurella multipotens]SDC72832.1 Multidrug efflux pump subunit AcrB [Desulfurella multipotens]
MNKYLNFLWSNKTTVFLCGILIIFGGIFSLFRLPESIFPNVNFPKVSILVHNQYLPVKYMLVSVTRPLEEAARTEPNVTLVRSQTGNGLSKIHVYFNSNVNPKTAYLMLQARIAKINLPPDSNVSIRLMEPNIYPFAEYALVSNKIDSSNIMSYYYFQVKPTVLGINGVYKVEETSRGWPEINIAIDPQKLLQYKISPQEIIHYLILNQGPFFSGVMNYFNQQLNLSTTSIDNIKDLSNFTIPIKSRNSEFIPLTLDKIADIKIQNPPLIKEAKVSGYKHALIMDILSQNKANEVKVSKELQKVFETIKDRLPSGIKLIKIYDLSDLIKSNLNDVWIALILGSIIALIVVMLFIGRIDGALSVFIVVPLSLSLTFIALYLMGFGLNIMTLGGICASIGAMIDHAIVIIERGLQNIESNAKKRLSGVFKRLKDILLPMSLATITSTVVFIPLIFLPGTLGLLFKHMAIAIIIALIASQLIALTFTPILSMMIVYRKTNKKIIPKNRKLYFMFSHSLIFFMRRPWISIIIILLVAATGYVCFKNLPTAFLPKWDEGLISVPFRTPVGSSVETTTKIGELLMNEASKNPNVDKVSLMVGRGFGNSFSTPNKAIMMIVLKKDRKESTQKVMLELDKKFKILAPNLISLNSSQIMVNRLGDLSGSHAPLEVFLFGSDPDKLFKEGQKLYKILAKNKDFESVTYKSPSAGPEIEFNPNYFATVNNINSKNLADTIKLYFWGENAGFLLKGEQLFPIRITLKDKPQTIQELKSLNIIHNDMPMALNMLSNINIKNSVPYITHQNLVPYSYIWVKPYSHIGLTKAANDIDNIVKHMNLPHDISYSIGGYYKQQTKSFQNMYLILTIALFILLILFGFQFSSQKCAIVAIIVISSTASFSLLSLLIARLNPDSTAFLGILLVFAIVVNNIILIFSRSKQLSKTHTHKSVALAVRSRLRPIIMTMSADIVGFLPLAIGIGKGTDLLKPLATATIGGLIFGAFASLIIAPSLFSLFSIVKYKK